MNKLHFLSTVDMSQVMDTERSLGDRFMQGLETIGLGMAIVFGVLIVIWIACELLHRAVSPATDAQAEEMESEEVTAVPAQTAAITPTVPAADNQELIAVITAAVAAMLDQPTSAFRVVSFRRTGENGRPWNRNYNA